MVVNAILSNTKHELKMSTSVFRKTSPSKLDAMRKKHWSPCRRGASIPVLRLKLRPNFSPSDGDESPYVVFHKKRLQFAWYCRTAFSSDPGISRFSCLSRTPVRYLVQCLTYLLADVSVVSGH